MRSLRSSSISLSVFTLVLFSATFCHAFQSGTGQPQRPMPPYSAAPPEDEGRIKLEKDMAKRANKDRQERLKQDTDKLFRLATELKEYVDKTNENTLSMEVIKKSEEIEKLAHSVKEKMRGGY